MSLTILFAFVYTQCLFHSSYQRYFGRYKSLLNFLLPYKDEFVPTHLRVVLNPLLINLGWKLLTVS